MTTNNSPTRMERSLVQLTVDLTFFSDSQFYADLTGDATRGGIFVATYQLLPLGTEVVVQMTTPFGAIDAFGTVRWSRDYRDGICPGLGIQFAELADREAHAIHQFCERRAPLYYDAEDFVLAG